MRRGPGSRRRRPGSSSREEPGAFRKKPSSEVMGRRKVEVDHGVGEENDAEAEDRKQGDAPALPAPPVDPEQEHVHGKRDQGPQYLRISKSGPELARADDPEQKGDDENGEADRDARPVHPTDDLERGES